MKEIVQKHQIDQPLSSLFFVIVNTIIILVSKQTLTLSLVGYLLKETKRESESRPYRLFTSTTFDSILVKIKLDFAAAITYGMSKSFTV